MFKLHASPLVILLVVVSSFVATWADKNSGTSKEIPPIPEELEPTPPNNKKTAALLSGIAHGVATVTDWPIGRYALVRAGPECPDQALFRKAGIYQDSEDFCTINEWTTEGFTGPMKQDGLRIDYCSKSTKKTGQGYWPAGDYCIHRYGDYCPYGFEEGSMLFDDENDENANRKYGRLPSGVYNEDTLQYFCCRNDSLASDPISLPSTHSFYLYRFTSHCQLVYDMEVYEETIFFDEEDTNNASYNTGSHPEDSGTDTDHRLHYCRYEPIMVTM